jgi:uncharacterized protein (TIGR02996 family)
LRALLILVLVVCAVIATYARLHDRLRRFVPMVRSRASPKQIDATVYSRPPAPRRRRPPTSPPLPPPPPLPAWHTVLSHDAEEQVLLEALRAQPDDAATRLVYADLLEQRGQLERAQFVRGTPMRLADRVVLATADDTWRAITSCAPIACPRDDCPGTWSALEPSSIDETLRRCRTCDQAVRHCRGAHASRKATARGELLVIELIPPRPLEREVGLHFDLKE